MGRRSGVVMLWSGLVVLRSRWVILVGMRVLWVVGVLRRDRGPGLLVGVFGIRLGRVGLVGAWRRLLVAMLVAVGRRLPVGVCGVLRWRVGVRRWLTFGRVLLGRSDRRCLRVAPGRCRWQVVRRSGARWGLGAGRQVVRRSGTRVRIRCGRRVRHRVARRVQSRRLRGGGVAVIGARLGVLAGRGNGLDGRLATESGHRRLRERMQLLAHPLEAGPPLLGLALAAVEIGGEVGGCVVHQLDRAAERQAVELVPLVGVHGRFADRHRIAPRAVVAGLGGQNAVEQLEARELLVVAADRHNPGRVRRQAGGRDIRSDPAAVDDHRHLVLGNGPQGVGMLGEGVENAAGAGRAARRRHHVEVLEQHILGMVDQMVAQHRESRRNERRRPRRELNAEVVAHRPPGGVGFDQQHLPARRGPVGGQVQRRGRRPGRPLGAQHGQHGAAPRQNRARCGAPGCITGSPRVGRRTPARPRPAASRSTQPARWPSAGGGPAPGHRLPDRSRGAR